MSYHSKHQKTSCQIINYWLLIFCLKKLLRMDIFFSVFQDVTRYELA